MRERVQKPFGFGGDIGLTVSGREGAVAQPDTSAGWRTSAGREQTKPPLPRIGQVLLAIIIVTAMAVALHIFFY